MLRVRVEPPWWRSSVDGWPVHGTSQQCGATLLHTRRDQAVIDFHSNETGDYRLLFQFGLRLGVRVD